MLKYIYFTDYLIHKYEVRYFFLSPYNQQNTYLRKYNSNIILQTATT